MSKTYTFSECYKLLNVDPKTFRGWLDEAGIDPDHQVGLIHTLVTPGAR
jgi:hypothetical protein